MVAIRFTALAVACLLCGCASLAREDGERDGVEVMVDAEPGRNDYVWREVTLGL